MGLRALVAGIAILSAGCPQPGAEHGVAARVLPKVSLRADSSTDDIGDTHVYYLVNVSTDKGTNTLPGVIAFQPPLVTPEGHVLGLSSDTTGALAFGYRYDPVSRKFDRFELPAGISTYFAAATLAPDGRHLAYVAQDSASILTAVVRAWPHGPEIVRQVAGPGFPSDVDYNHVRWRSVQVVEMAVRIEPGDGPWVRIVASTDGTVAVDTLTRPPEE